MIDEDLAFLGATPSVRAALYALPPAFASAFAADARRIVESQGIPVRPSVPDDFRLAPPPNPYAAHFTDGMEHPAVLRWRIVIEIMRLDAARLLAACMAFKMVLAAWKADRGQELEADGPDCPPVAVRPWGLEYEAKMAKADRELARSPSRPTGGTA